MHETIHKEKAYENLDKLINNHKKSGPVIVTGDFNARIQRKIAENETCIGNHTLDRENTNIESLKPEIIENRNLLVKLCQEQDFKIINTFFPK